MAEMALMWITNDPDEAKFVLACGVNRIFVDLEHIGKHDRQVNTSSHLADHTPKDVAKIREQLPTADILVRINPIHAGTREEIEVVLEGEPDQIMLPMFTSKVEVHQLEEIINGRAPITLLVETPQALARLPDILGGSQNVSEIYIGLNDLYLSMGLDFIFEPLAGGLVDVPAAIAKEFDLRFGFGGIGRIGEGQAPADLILSEHVRLGSDMVILSRSFRSDYSIAGGAEWSDLAGEIQKLRDKEEELRLLDQSSLLSNTRALRSLVYNEAERRRYIA
jgi:hypothetical protein